MAVLGERALPLHACWPRVARMQLRAVHDDTLPRLQVRVLKGRAGALPAIELLVQLVGDVVELEEPPRGGLVAGGVVPREVDRMLVLGAWLLVLDEDEISVVGGRRVGHKAPGLEARGIAEGRPLKVAVHDWDCGPRKEGVAPRHDLIHRDGRAAQLHVRQHALEQPAQLVHIGVPRFIDVAAVREQVH